jgi:hypothetical protein
MPSVVAVDTCPKCHLREPLAMPVCFTVYRRGVWLPVGHGPAAATDVKEHVMADAPRSPRLSGAALRNLARVARTRVGGIALQRVLRRDLRIDELATLPDELRGSMPLDTNAHPGRPPRTGPSAGLPVPSGNAWSPSMTTLAAAYRTGRVSPREVVRSALDEARRLAALEPTVGPLCEYAEEAALAEAEASE